MAIEGKRRLKLIGTIFAIIGVVLLLLAGWAGRRQYRILKSWPSVEAEVVNSKIIRNQDAENGTMYRAAIDFRYVVAGKEYTVPGSSSYSSSSYSMMKQKVDDYAIGTRRPIRYNPADPGDMRFDVGYSFSFFFLPAILGLMGLIFGGLGVGTLLAARMQQDRRCPSCGQMTEKGQNFCPNCSARLPVE